VSAVDIVLIIIFSIGAFSGYRKGFLSELFSLLAVILGILAGFKLMGVAMLMLGKHYSIDEKVLPYVAFAVVFFLVMIIVSLLGKLLKSFLEKTVLGSADQVAGSVLGLAKTTFIVSVLIWIASSLEVNIPEHWSEDSWLYPFTAKLAPTVTSWIAEVFPVFSDLFGDPS
jgi:membrane protein required for colicin V production